MTQDKNRQDAAETDSTKGFVGDVEMAGETTAAAAIEGPVDALPVGADTMIKVADTDEQAGKADEKGEKR